MQTNTSTLSFVSRQNKHGSQMVLLLKNNMQSSNAHSLNTEQTWVTDGLKNMQSSHTDTVNTEKMQIFRWS